VSAAHSVLAGGNQAARVLRTRKATRPYLHVSLSQLKPSRMDGNTMLKTATVRRSACDQCRAKRVRCLRAEHSMVPCARCSHIGARCVTGVSGHPGRPRKPRLINADSSPRGPAASPADVVPSLVMPTSTLRDMNHADLHVSAMAAESMAPSGSGLDVSKFAVHPPRDPDPNPDQLAHGPQSDFWEASGDSTPFFLDSPPTAQSPVPGEDILALVNPLSSPSQLRGLLSADDELNTMLHIARDMDSSTALEMDIDPLLDLWEGVLSQSPIPQCFSAASLLLRFREEMDQRIAMVDAYFSDPLKVMQGCKEEQEGGPEVENPAALLLTCSKEFIDIIQSLSAPKTLAKDSYPQSQLVPPNLVPAMDMQTDDVLSTEIVLLTLSGYLALMRLYDSLFYCIYQCVYQVPPNSLKSLKVKSVLRIGGISSLQDMPLKTYATGILEAIQGQVQTLEHCMGIPTEYCLSGEAAATPGIFSRADRARLFCTTMEQEDVKSRRGGKSYVESIRASIQDSMGFLDWATKS